MTSETSFIPYQAFLYWLLLAGLILFGFYLALDLGLVAGIVNNDATRLSLIIALIFIVSSSHCAWRSWVISRQSNLIENLAEKPGETVSEQSLARDYLQAVRGGRTEADSAQLAEVLAETIRGSHKVGWFIVGALIKLGLLGTVIGFVLMLRSVSGLDSLDIADIKQLMQQMTQGMGIAMNTTLVGLVCSLLLGLQYLLLDRSADRFVVSTINLGQRWRADQASNSSGDGRGAV